MHMELSPTVFLAQAIEICTNVFDYVQEIKFGRNFRALGIFFLLLSECNLLQNHAGWQSLPCWRLVCICRALRRLLTGVHFGSGGRSCILSSSRKIRHLDTNWKNAGALF